MIPLEGQENRVSLQSKTHSVLRLFQTCKSQKVRSFLWTSCRQIQALLSS